MTLLGHGSSGATNAMLHLTNPKTAALFARMILMSGTIYSTYSYQNTVETMNATADTDLSLAIVKKLACGSVHVKYTLDCLRQKSVNDILKAFEHVYEVHLIDTIPFRFECLKLFQFSTKLNGFGFFYSLNILIIPAWKLYKIIGSTNWHIFAEINAILVKWPKKSIRARWLSKYSDFDGIMQQWRRFHSRLLFEKIPYFVHFLRFLFTISYGFPFNMYICIIILVHSMALLLSIGKNSSFHRNNFFPPF